MPTDGAADGNSDDVDERTLSDDHVVDVAADAAEDVVFSRFDTSDVEDVDVTVSFDDGVLDVDVYVHAPDGRAEEEQVARDAALAARSAVDDLF